MQYFVVSRDHIKLVQKLYITYDSHTEFGAPAVDPKRPYGNSGVYEDIGEILGVPAGPIGYDDKTIEYMDQLHREMETCLQILVRTLGLKEGLYEADDYLQNWRESPT